MSSEPKASGALDTEMLAAYIDKRLSPEARAVVEAKLATDPESYELLVELIHANEALQDQRSQDEEQPEPEERKAARQDPPGRVVPLVPKAPTTKVWALAGGVLAVAAALVLVVRLQPDLLQRLRGGDAVDPQLARLFVAEGDARSVDVRIVGAREHRPVRVVTRGTEASSRNLTLLSVAGAAQEAAAADPSAKNLHAWGVAQLLLGDYDGAVQALREAANQDAAVAAYENDLAGALLTRGKMLARPEDFAPSLAAVDRALALDADLIEARFNRALALEALFLDSQAIAAWQAYLAIDSASGWADEAREHLAALAERPKASAWSAGDAVSMASAFRTRDWLLSVALPEWAAAIRDGGAASAIAGRIVETAEQLQHVTSDRAGEIIIEDVTRLPSTPGARAAAEGYLALAAGLAAVRLDRLDQIGASFRSACASFRIARSRFTPLCEMELAFARFQERDVLGARREAERLVPILAAAGALASRGRAQWLVALASMMDDLAGAAEPTRQTAQLFESIGEWPSAARMWNQESDASYWSGRYRDSWHSRARALELASRVQDDYVSYAVFASVSAVLQNEQQPGPAAAFAAAAAAPRGRPMPPLMRLFPLQRTLLTAVEVGDLDQARAARRDLEAIVASSTDRRLAAMTGDIQIAIAALQRAEGQPEAADATLVSAIATMGPERQLGSRLWAQLGRAEIQLGLGDLVAAKDELRRVVDGLASRGGAAINLRMSDVGRVRRATAKLVLQAGTPDWDTLALFDEARTALAADHRRVLTTSAVTESLPEGVAVVAYVDDGEQLGCWVITRSTLSFHHLSETSDSVARQVSRLAYLVRVAQAGSPAWTATLTGLHAGLLGPVQSALAQVVTVYVVADGATRGVPFAALLDDQGKPAIERWTMAAVPSVSATLAMDVDAPIESRRGVAIIGDPANSDTQPLPGARQEAIRIAATYPPSEGVTTLLGGDATRSNVEVAIAKARVVHFAGHAVSDTVNPGRSYLQLAARPGTDGRWFVDDLRPGMFSRDQIIVLAACQTADGSADPRESVASLAEAVLRAGAGAVIASLWPIADTESQALFEAFHRGVQQGHSAEVSLREAANEFMKGSSSPARVAAVSGVQAFRTTIARRTRDRES